MTKFETRICKAFDQFLSEHKFKKRFESLDDLRFGNAIIEYVSGDISLRFVSDRDDLLVYFGKGTSPVQWEALHLILQRFGVDRNSLDFSDDQQVAHALAREYQRIERHVHERQS